MTDRELLELAAKAAGINLEWFKWTNKQTPDAAIHKGNYWNPLTDDGDAFRLAVKLFITPIFFGSFVMTGTESTGLNSATAIQDFYDDHRGDIYAATRRAIVRAAAEMGK